MCMRGRLILVVLVLLMACGEPPTPVPTSPPRAEPEPLPETKPLVLLNYALSDLLWESSSNALGPLEKDSSNGGKAGGDGNPLTINGKTYDKGLGVAAPSEIVFNLGGVCSSFTADVGVDDQAEIIGSISFEVYGDNQKIWESDLLITTNPFKATGTLSITGVQTLKLVTSDAGDGNQNDYAAWASPTISCESPPPALAPPDAQSKGVFGLVQPWPTIPTQATLLPDSTIIAWYSRDTDGTTRNQDYNDQDAHSFTLVDVWDIATNTHSSIDNTTTDLFCAGSTLGSDGNLYVAGGNLGSNSEGYYPGSRFTNIFNVATQSWSHGPDMTEGRWYPSIITLPNKELLIMEGNSNETTVINHIADVWNPTTNTLRRLTSASTENRNVHPLYPWIHVAPNGRVFYTGASSSMAYLDTRGRGSWSETYTRDNLYRGYGSSVMYEPGKILVVGGGGETSSAVTIDLTNSVEAKETSPLNFGRSNLDATLLPDGSIFVNGGNTSGEVFDDATSVYVSEIWNPATGIWTLGAEAKEPRNYHSVALLLPDGRVWTAGGGGCGSSCNANHQNAEIYYPPYLFKKDGSGLLADRPVIREAPENMSYDESYTLTTTDSITKVALVALGSVTHAFNMNQRYVPLTLEGQTESTLTVTSPENANLAPPGYYMLFVVDNEGVPSMARIVQVQ